MLNLEPLKVGRHAQYGRTMSLCRPNNNVSWLD